MYADGTTLVYAADNAEDLVSKINLVLDKMSSSPDRNTLKINTNKTKAVIFRTKHKPLPSICRVALHSVDIELVVDI